MEKAPHTPAGLHPDTSSSFVRDLAAEFNALHGAETCTLKEDGENPIVAILPKDKKVENLRPLFDAWLDKPRRRRGTSRVDDLQSLVEMTERFNGVDSAIFADRSGGEAVRFQTVFNYHPEGDDNADAAWCDHRAEYSRRCQIRGRPGTNGTPSG